MQNTHIQKELILRRNSLANNMKDNSVCIFLSNQESIRNADVENKFRQDSNFWYFGGIDSPDCCLVIIKKNAISEVILFVPKPNPSKEIWHGKQAGAAEYKNSSGVDNILFFEDIESNFGMIFDGCENLYFDYGDYSYYGLRAKIMEFAGSTKRRSKTEFLRNITKTKSIVEPLRLIKSKYEIEQLRKSANIAILAHLKMNKAMRNRIENGDVLYEYNLESELLSCFGNNGVTWSYLPIVASGSNACTLHYNKNRDCLRFQDMVLVDAGCEYGYYASDITRMYPVSGHFSNSQKIVYEAVLKSQLCAINELSKPSCSNLSYHSSAVYSLVESLIDMGILTGNVSENVRSKNYMKYFMHGTGHFLGLDVHDIGPYKDSSGNSIETKLTFGMVLTVEPGLYFGIDDQSIPKEFRGIGVRIEDDVLITDSGCEVLTEDLPKSIEGIEGLIF